MEEGQLDKFLKEKGIDSEDKRITLSFSDIDDLKDFLNEFNIFVVQHLPRDFNIGAELTENIYKEGEATWGCKNGVLDVDDVNDYLNMITKDIKYDKGICNSCSLRCRKLIFNKLNSKKAVKTCATKHGIPPKSKDSGILPNFT